jgi:hypothetical protein
MISALDRIGVDFSRPMFGTSEDLKGIAATVNRVLSDLDREKIGKLDADLSDAQSRAVVAQNSVVGKFLSSDLLLFAGEISFGVYLFHRFALLGLDGMGIANLPGPIRLAAVLIATTLIAWLANIFIERPSRFVIRSWGDKLLALR